MNLLGKLSELFDPIGRLIDSLHTSDDERLKAKQALIVVQAGIITEALAYERAMVEQQAAIIQTEAKAEDWLTRNWRPLTMLGFVSLIVLNWFGVGPTELPPDLWDVIKIGLGGYVVGRSLEKIVPPAIEAVKAKEQ